MNPKSSDFHPESLQSTKNPPWASLNLDTRYRWVECLLALKRVNHQVTRCDKGIAVLLSLRDSWAMGTQPMYDLTSGGASAVILGGDTLASTP